MAEGAPQGLDKAALARRGEALSVQLIGGDSSSVPEGVVAFMEDVKQTGVDFGRCGSLALHDLSGPDARPVVPYPVAATMRLGFLLGGVVEALRK